MHLLDGKNFALFVCAQDQVPNIGCGGTVLESFVDTLFRVPAVGTTLLGYKLGLETVKKGLGNGIVVDDRGEGQHLERLKNRLDRGAVFVLCEKSEVLAKAKLGHNVEGHKIEQLCHLNRFATILANLTKLVHE